ncbi:MAG: glycosyltransferase [Candidatus Promineifilaceae bacterium]
MRILILTPQLPYPPHQGTTLRNYYIIRGLTQHHEVTLLTFVEQGQAADDETTRPLRQHLYNFYTVPAPTRSTAKRLWQLATTTLPDMAHRLYSREFATMLRCLTQDAHRFDLVQIEGIELARYIYDIRVANKTTPIIFDNHNAETELQKRNMLTDLRTPRRWAAAFYSLVQVLRLRRFERWACRQADGVTAVSETDLRLLQTLVNQPGKPLAAIPNSLDVEDMAQAAANCPTDPGTSFDLLFTGKMDYRPNVDAVLWFAAEIFPLIKAQRPQTTLAVVGQKPHARLARLHEVDGVTVTGWVESVRPYLAQALVMIMPFRVGSGTRLKLIEAMAAGKAVVSTRVGAEGFPVENGRHLILVDEPAQFAQAVLALLNSPEKRQILGKEAAVFARQYDWRVVIPQFDAFYSRVMD